MAGRAPFAPWWSPNDPAEDTIRPAAWWLRPAYSVTLRPDLEMVNAAVGATFGSSAWPPLPMNGSAPPGTARWSSTLLQSPRLAVETSWMPSSMAHASTLPSEEKLGLPWDGTPKREA